MKPPATTGYLDCPCCFDIFIGAPGDLCDECEEAGCEANREGAYDDCLIDPECHDHDHDHA